MESLIDEIKKMYMTSDGSQIPEVHMAVETYNQAIDDVIKLLESEFDV